MLSKDLLQNGPVEHVTPEPLVVEKHTHTMCIHVCTTWSMFSIHHDHYQLSIKNCMCQKTSNAEFVINGPPTMTILFSKAFDRNIHSLSDEINMDGYCAFHIYKLYKKRYNSSFSPPSPARSYCSSYGLGTEYRRATHHNRSLNWVMDVPTACRACE